MPTGLTYISDNASQGTYDDATGIWTVGDLAADGLATLDITVRIDDVGPFTNVAEVTAADQPDTDSEPDNDNPTEDDQDQVGVGGIEADLELTKMANQSVIGVGENITYTLEIVNNGPAEATSVEVTDQLAAALTFVSSDPTQGSYNATSGVWFVGELQPNATAQLQITATVTEAGDISNSAEVTNSDQEDPDSTPDNDDPDEDDQDDTTITAELVDLSIEKTASSNSVNVGENFTYTVSLTNDGPSDATGVQVTDELPGQVSYVSSNAQQGTYSSGSGIWNVGSIPAGQTYTLDITVKVEEAGEFINVAQVTESNQPDDDSTPNNNDPDEDDQDDEPVTGVQIDLELSKEVDVTTVNINEDVTYTLVLENKGVSDATGVQVTDELPAGLTFVSSDPSVGTYDETTGIWNVGDIAAAGTETL